MAGLSLRLRAAQRGSALLGVPPCSGFGVTPALPRVATDIPAGSPGGRVTLVSDPLGEGRATTRKGESSSASAEDPHPPPAKACRDPLVTGGGDHLQLGQQEGGMTPQLCGGGQGSSLLLSVPHFAERRCSREPAQPL